MDRIATGVAKTAATTGCLDLQAVVNHAQARSARRQPEPISTGAVQAGLARLDARAKLLNEASTALDGSPAVTLGHLPGNPDLCSLPQHWFEAAVARWYAFCFDGGPRLMFLNRLDVRAGDRLVHVARGVSSVPPLLQALRTWQAHGLDPSADRARKQRVAIDQWMVKRCGTPRPRVFHWRGLTAALILEVERYLAQLTSATQLLARHPGSEKVTARLRSNSRLVGASVSVDVWLNAVCSALSSCWQTS